MDYNEILCQAIDTIVAKRISEVSFDKTILCTITDNSKKENGEYTVTDGSVSFQAFSESNKYQKGHQVYVQIPMGNYADKKIILGRYSSEGDEMPIAYVSPLDQIVPMSANYAEDLISYGLIANSTNQVIPLLDNKEINEDTVNYDTLCVKADFKCLLQNYIIKSGNYGLSILLTTEDNQTINIELDCTQDMFGNPYAYTSYFTQSQAYKLNLTSNIKTIGAYFYQKANFTYNTGRDIEPQPVPVQDYENIFINNIEIYFAYDTSSVVDNTVKINTADGLEYNGISKENLNKTLSLIWYNKDENNKYIGFTDGEFGTLEDAKDVEKNIYFIQWEHSLNNGSWEPVAENVLDIEVELNPLWSINEYRAVITFQGNTYTSNILQFVSKTGLENEIKNSLNLRLTLHNGEYSLDSYPLYGADTVLINPLEAHRQRELYFFYESAIGGSLEPDALSGATAYFYIPNNVTMLEQPSDQSRLLDEDKTANWYMEGYTTYAYTFGPSITQKDKTFKYCIKKNYNPLFINNTVLLRIIDENGYEYFTSKSFSFSCFGTSGTDYTIIISDINGQDYVVGNNSLSLQAQLYDANFEEIVSGESEEEQIQWTWSLYPNGALLDSPNGIGKNASSGYRVVQASTNVKWAGENDTTISALYPIAYSNDSDCMYQGPTTIIYNSSGVNPTYYEGDIRLFRKSNNSSIPCSWTIEYYRPNNLDSLAGTGGSDVASLTSVSSLSPYPRLKPSPIYLSNNDTYLVLCARDARNVILWRQPLVFLQNQYPSALLNNWDGELIIDNAGNYILSAMLGAGSKNSNNQFTGVLIGEMGNTKSDIKVKETGLFGYHEGAQSFGFNTDGTAFIGKSGQGRIEFYGDKGVIKSADDKGMVIDLSEGKITASNFSLSANNDNFILNSNPEGTNPYFKIQTNNENGSISYTQDGLAVKGEIVATRLMLNDGAETNLATRVFAEEIESLAFSASSAASSAYQKANDAQSATNTLDTKVTGYLTGGGTTLVGGNYVITPYIGGGYLNISGSNTQVTINPQNIAGGGGVFTITSNGNQVFSVDASGNAIFSGKLNAATGTFSGELNAATGIFKGGLNVNDVFKVDGETGEMECTAGKFKGDISGATGTFTGALNCTGVIIEGQLTASRGSKIGPFTIENDVLYYSYQGAYSSLGGGTLVVSGDGMEIDFHARNNKFTITGATLSSCSVDGGPLGNKLYALESRISLLEDQIKEIKGE